MKVDFFSLTNRNYNWEAMTNNYGINNRQFEFLLLILILTALLHIIHDATSILINDFNYYGCAINVFVNGVF